MKKDNFIDPILLEKESFRDERGFFKETYRKKWFHDIDNSDFVQDNLSFSKKIGTLRGMHLQKKPFAQSKIVQCLNGHILDVVVDLRKKSKNYLKNYSYNLKGEDNFILYVPEGFAHGFITLEKNTLVTYKVNNYYSPKNEISISWKDPAMNITWPLTEDEITLADKDLNAASLYEHNLNF